MIQIKKRTCGESTERCVKSFSATRAESDFFLGEGGKDFGIVVGRAGDAVFRPGNGSTLYTGTFPMNNMLVCIFKPSLCTFGRLGRAIGFRLSRESRIHSFFASVCDRLLSRLTG